MTIKQKVLAMTEEQWQQFQQDTNEEVSRYPADALPTRLVRLIKSFPRLERARQLNASWLTDDLVQAMPSLDDDQLKQIMTYDARDMNRRMCRAELLRRHDLPTTLEVKRDVKTYTDERLTYMLSVEFRKTSIEVLQEEQRQRAKRDKSAKQREALELAKSSELQLARRLLDGQCDAEAVQREYAFRVHLLDIEKPGLIYWLPKLSDGQLSSISQYCDDHSRMKLIAREMQQRGKVTRQMREYMECHMTPSETARI